MEQSDFKYAYIASRDYCLGILLPNDTNVSIFVDRYCPKEAKVINTAYKDSSVMSESYLREQITPYLNDPWMKGRGFGEEQSYEDGTEYCSGRQPIVANYQ